MTALIIGSALLFQAAPAPAEGPKTVSFTVSFDENTVLAEGEKISAPALLQKFYETRSFAPAWIENGRPVAGAKDLLNAIQQADREGLRPSDYHLHFLREMMDTAHASTPVAPDQQTQLELSLSDAFLTYGSDLLSGRINPYSVDSDWFAGRRTGDLPTVLELGLESGNIRQTLRDLLPTNPVYQRMRAALARYRQFERNGGWPEIEPGPKLEKGDKDPRVVVLRKRLHLEGDLNQKPSSRELFDVSVERGLKHFQKRNGLDADGILGENTLKALNISAATRVRQLQINMERCRWLPDNLGAKYVFVNVPAFSLQVMEDNREVLAMKVVVGRKMRQTPVFSSAMTHLVFNPPWNVPVTVARMDVLDHIHEDPGYLASHNFEVFEGYDEGAPPVDQAKVDWSKVTPQNLKYKFRQKPGPLNALGRIKFLLPNRFDVYLHDTSSPSLFSKTVRDFSSGCIRVEKPIDLALYVLKDDPRWTREKIVAAIGRNSEQAIPIPEKIPVHLMYWTAWVDEGNVVQFREDIYGRDRMLDEAMARETPL